MKLSLDDIQYYQELHDKRYHVDIYTMPLLKRIAHLHQHLVKYTNSRVSSETKQEDMLACILSIANALGVRLSVELREFDILVDTLDDIKPYFDANTLAPQLNTVLSRIAKMLEGMDHHEYINVRKGLSSQVAMALLILVHQYTLDHTSPDTLVTSWIIRLRSIKEKNIWHSHYHLLDMKEHPIYNSVTSWLYAIQNPDISYSARVSKVE
jgi:hypothetical protein